MKRCSFCNAELEDNQTKCDYCGKEQIYNQMIDLRQTVNDNNQIYNYQGNQESYQKQENQDNYKKDKKILILLIISIILCIGACFLPFISIGDFSMNYVFTEKVDGLSNKIDIKDGILIIIFEVITLLTLLKGKKRAPALIFQLLSLGVFAFDYFDLKNKLFYKVLKVVYDGNIYGIGFYLVLVFLIISTILSLIRIIKKDIYD